MQAEKNQEGGDLNQTVWPTGEQVIITSYLQVTLGLL